MQESNWLLAKMARTHKMEVGGHMRSGPLDKHVFSRVQCRPEDGCSEGLHGLGLRNLQRILEGADEDLEICQPSQPGAWPSERNWPDLYPNADTAGPPQAV